MDDFYENIAGAVISYKRFAQKRWIADDDNVVINEIISNVSI